MRAPQRFPYYAEYAPLTGSPQVMQAASVSTGFPLALPYAFPKAVAPINGDGWVKSSERVKVLYPCRMQPVSGTNTTTTTDGEMVQFSDYIYLDRSVQPAPYGGEVRIFADEAKTNLIGVRKVKRFFQNQLHTKIWV